MLVHQTTVRRKRWYTDHDLRSLPLPDRGHPAHTNRAVAREKDIHDQGNPAMLVSHKICCNQAQPSCDSTQNATFKTIILQQLKHLSKNWPTTFRIPDWGCQPILKPKEFQLHYCFHQKILYYIRPIYYIICRVALNCFMPWEERMRWDRRYYKAS